jgi:hypothetical protein
MGRSTTTPFLLIFVLTGACDTAPLLTEIPQSTYDRFDGLDAGTHTLFGLPPENGPITEACCMPTCAFQQGKNLNYFTSPRYTKEDMETLYDGWELVEHQGNPCPPLPLDWKPDNPKKVCAVLPRPELEHGDAMPYELHDFGSAEEAQLCGAQVTHSGQCGACSSLQNLAIYIANPNLTEPIRACAMTGLVDRDLSGLACIASLGFDLPCARAWYANTENTQELCIAICGRRKNRTAPGNKPFECEEFEGTPEDIKLVNDCLACDELFSLDLFRKAAGRSRRGSGLPSPICRTCEGVYPVVHRYSKPDR